MHTVNLEVQVWAQVEKKTDPLPRAMSKITNRMASAIVWWTVMGRVERSVGACVGDAHTIVFEAMEERV